MKKITNTESYTYEGAEYTCNIFNKYAYRTEDGRKVRIPYSVYTTNKTRAAEAEKAAKEAAEKAAYREADRAYLESIRPRLEKRKAFYAYLETVPYETLENAKRLMQKAGYEQDFTEYSLHFFSIYSDDEVTFETVEEIIEFANSKLNPTETAEATEATEQKGETEMSTTNTNESIFSEAETEQLYTFVDYMNSVPEETKTKALKLMEQLGYEPEFFRYNSLHFVNYDIGHDITFLRYEDVIEFAESELNPIVPTDRVFLVGDRLSDGLGDEVSYEVIDRTAKTVTLRKHDWDELTASDRTSDHEYPITCDENRNQVVVLYTNSVWGDTCLTATSENPDIMDEAAEAYANGERPIEGYDPSASDNEAEPTTASPEAVVEPKEEPKPQKKGKDKAYYRFWYTYHNGFRRETEKAIALDYFEGVGFCNIRWIPKSIILWGPVNCNGNQFFYVPKWFFFRNRYDIHRFEYDGEVMASQLTDHDIGGESYVDYNGQEIVVFENDGNIRPEGRVIDTIDGYEICREEFYNHDLFARKI